MVVDTLSRMEKEKDQKIELNRKVNKLEVFEMFKQYGIQEHLVPVDYVNMHNA